MGLRVQTNVEALQAHRNLNTTSALAAKSQEKLSSGFRINRAGDDAAGLAISEKLTAQVRGLGQAQRNVQDGISFVQTAEGALSEVHSMLQRARELKVQYDNGTLSASDQAAIQAEATALGAEVARIATSSKFNGIDLLTGTNATFVVGADGETIATTAFDLATTVPAATFTLSAATALADIDTAIGAVSTARSDFGAVQNRLEHTYNNLAVYEENLNASLSRIKDVDVAREMVNLTKLQIVQQAGTAMLAQANQAPQGVLSLLR
jgi:flagellin